MDRPHAEFPLGPFRPYHANPVLRPRGEGWESANVYNPAAVVKDGKVVLLYRAHAADLVSHVGLATSSDGYAFDRRPDPVLSPSEEYDAHGCEDPRVAEVDGTYYLTYTGLNRGSTGEGLDRACAQLCLATSRDLVDWTKHGPMFPDFNTFLPSRNAPAGPWSKAGAILETPIDGRYLMYFGEGSIYHAWSDDLLHWTPASNDEPLMLPTPDSFSAFLVEVGPQPIITNNGLILLLYNAAVKNADGSVRYTCGQALFDPTDPTRVLARMDRPWLEPSTYEDNHGLVSHVTFVEGLVHFDGRWLAYYGQSDSTLGVAVHRVGERYGAGLSGVAGAIAPTPPDNSVRWVGLPAHHRWLESETDRLLGFAPAAAHPDGGFGWLDERGRLDTTHAPELWITCRMTHVAALGTLLGRPGPRALLEHGLRSLEGPFRDQVGGGWHATLPGEAHQPKGAYEAAFVVLAASSATIAGHPAGPGLLGRALDAVTDRFWEEEQGMVADSWDASTGRLDPYRGVNANMHTVEAFLAAGDATGDRVWSDRAFRIVERVLDGYARSHGFRVPEHFDDSWNPILDYNRLIPADRFRPYGVTIGHGLEWARLALHLREALGAETAPSWLLDHARALFDTAVRDGWAVDGAPGFVYTVDWDGAPVVRERMHWVAAEAVSAAAALWSATGDDEYAEWYQTWWDYIAATLIDEPQGSWHHELDHANRPSATIWPGKPDLYHAVQATLIPRLPLAPCLAAGLARGLLDR